MTLDQLITELRIHAEKNPDEKDASHTIIDWIEKHGEFAFVKANLEGHLTASLIVMNEQRDKMLLMLHKKLQLWVWFGGHCDGDIDVKNVAIREFHEESGSIQVPYVFPDIFHVDIHDIPWDSKWRPPHKHFDILFLAIISETVPLCRQENEVDDIGWFTLDEVIERNPEPLMHSIIGKIRKL